MRHAGCKLIALVLGISVAACGDKKDDSGGGETESPPAQTAAPTKLTFAKVIAGTEGPGLLGPFSAGEFGMTKAELEAAVPAFAEHGDYLSERDFGIGLFVNLDGEPPRLDQQRITLPVADAGEIDKAWGPGTEITYRRKPAKIWLAADAKVRAILTEGLGGDADHRSLVIEPYMPAAEILGEPGKPLGIETARPFLGATPDELQAAYPEAFDRALESLAFMKWTADEYGDQFKMQLGLEDGKVNELQFWIHHGDNETAKADALALLEAKYGEAKKVKTALGRDKLQLGDAPKVIVGETEGAWVVEVTES